MKKAHHFMRYLLLLSFLISIFLAWNAPVLADVGNINRYEDYGGNNGGGSGGGGDMTGMIYMLTYAIRILGPGGTIVLVVVVGGVYIFMKRNDGSTTGGVRTRNVDPRTVFASASDDSYIEQEIQQVDPNFSAPKFKTWAGECYVTLQNAWTKREWQPIRPFESNELFRIHQQQLDQYITQHKINVVDRINIYNIQLLSFDQDEQHDRLSVRLQATIRDYVIDERTKAVLEGNPAQDYHLTYRIVFIRRTGVTTPETNELAVTNCPNCGAPTEITSAGKCSYCQSVITNGDYSWVMSELSSM